MEYNGYINCHCFNPDCNKSIFNYPNYSVVRLPLLKVLSEENCCPECGDELISKPILEIRSLICNCNILMDAAVMPEH